MRVEGQRLISTPPFAPVVLGIELTLLILFLTAFVAGIAGSYLGIGGGVLLVPFMALVLGVDIRVAIATSLVGVIATSTGAASVYVRDHLTNLRLGMFLEVGTTLGAITGAFVALLVDRTALFIVFGIVVMYAASQMARGGHAVGERGEVSDSRPPSRFGQRLRLRDTYLDQEHGGRYTYDVSRTGAGLGISMVAGAVSGLLGVGGGFIKVPMMNLVMRVPMKAAVATSNFMIGVTAAASAFIYYARGALDPSLAGAIVVGVFLGTRLGTRLMVKAKARSVRLIFAAFLVGIGVFMILRPFLGVNF